MAPAKYPLTHPEPGEKAVTILRTRFARSLAFIAAAHVAGGHWLVLQIVAWTGMLISYSGDAGIGEAIGKTFDGSAPCALCEAVQDGQHKESDPPLVEFSSKQEALLSRPVSIPAPRAVPFQFDSGISVLFSRLPAAPSPPPPRLV